MRQATRVQGHPRRASARSWRDRNLTLVAAVAAAALIAAACSEDSSPEPTDAGAETPTTVEAPTVEVPTILATTSIWGDVVANVACDGLAEVGVIIPVGSDPHGYEPSLQDTERMTNASLIVANGLTLEGRLEDTLHAVEDSGTPVLEFAAEMDPIPFEDSHDEEGHDDHDEMGHDDHDEEGHDDHANEHDDHDEMGHDDHANEHDDHADEHDDHDEEGHDDHADEHDDHDEMGHDDHDEEGHDDHGHDHGAEDPHVWFDPHRVAEALPALAQALTTHAGLDPAAVEACLLDYRTELEAVDAEIAAKVDQLPAESRKLVTNHEALAYFADRYGFEVIGTVIPSPSSMAEPNPRRAREAGRARRARGNQGHLRRDPALRRRDRGPGCPCGRRRRGHPLHRQPRASRQRRRDLHRFLAHQHRPDSRRPRLNRAGCPQASGTLWTHTGVGRGAGAGSRADRTAKVPLLASEGC